MSAFGHVLLPEAPPGGVPLWRQIVRGVSQLGFQTNELTALFVLAAVAVHSWRSAAFLIIAVVVGTITARLLGAIPDMLDQGLYGFNSCLIGISMGAFYEPNATTWVLVPVLAALVAGVAVLLSRTLPFPALAAPFILCFWILWPFAERLGMVKVAAVPYDDSNVAWLTSILNALGSALFAGIVVSGILFVIGVALSNWRHAVVAVAGVIVAHWIADQGEVPGGAINAGVIGFNAVLASIAVYSMLGEDLRLTLFGAIGATLLVRAFNLIGLVPLAAGFVTITWLLMFLAWLNPRFNAKPDAAAEPATA